MRLHLLRDPFRARIAEPHAQPAADDHALDVEHVHDRGDARAERTHRALDRSAREPVAVLERSRPDAAGQARAVVLLHQPEQVGVAPLLVLAAHPCFHGRAAGVSLDTADAPARAARAVQLDDHVADLACASAAVPRLAVEDQAAPHSGAPEDPEQRAVGLARTQLELRFGRHLHVVADPHPAAERRF